MLKKIFLYAAISGMTINLLLFGFAIYMQDFGLQILSLANIFLLNFIFLRE